MYGHADVRTEPLIGSLVLDQDVLFFYCVMSPLPFQTAAVVARENDNESGEDDEDESDDDEDVSNGNKTDDAAAEVASGSSQSFKVIKCLNLSALYVFHGQTLSFSEVFHSLILFFPCPLGV